MVVAQNPFEMSPEEVATFLNEPRYMACTTLKADGTPVTIFLGYEWDDGALYFSVRNSRLIVRRLERDPRAWVGVTNEYYPSKYVTMSGTVTTIEDPGWERTLRMFNKYMSPRNDFQHQKDIDLEPFLEGYFDVGRTVYRLVPDQIRSEDGSKWEPGAAGISDDRARERGSAAD
jgi:hypothetical protein